MSCREQMLEWSEDMEYMLPRNAYKIQQFASRYGWNTRTTINPAHESVVVRFDKPGEHVLPGFISWHKGRFDGAACSNFEWAAQHHFLNLFHQKLTYGDVYEYLEDPDVIWEDEDDDRDWT